MKAVGKPVVSVKWLLFAGLIVIVGLASTTAVAQTTMQRQQAQQQQDDEVEDDQADADEEEPASVEEARTRRQGGSDDTASDGDDDTDSRGPTAPGEEEGYTQSEWTQSHLPGFRIDLGTDFDDVQNWGLGLGYMFATNWRIRVLQTELLFRGGVGPDLTFVGGTDEGFDGTNLYATGRLTGTGPRGGMTLMLGVGWGIYGQGFVPAAKIGAFYATEALDIGYFYQTAYLGDFQPDWMTPHNFGFRFHIPLIEY